MTHHLPLRHMADTLARWPWTWLLPAWSAHLREYADMAERVQAIQEAAIKHWRDVAAEYRREAEAFRQLARDTELEAQDAEDHARRVHEARTRAKADGVLVELPRCRLVGARGHAAFPPLGA